MFNCQYAAANFLQKIRKFLIKQIALTEVSGQLYFLFFAVLMLYMCHCNAEHRMHVVVIMGVLHIFGVEAALDNVAVLNSV